MRQSAVEHTLALFRRHHIVATGLATLEVGGTRRVWLEPSHYAPPTPAARLRQRIMRRIGLATVPRQRPAAVATDNPLLKYFPDLQFLDYGFNAAVLGTESNMQADFLDPACAAALANSYDLVLCFDTLEHVSDPFTFCRHLVQVARPGGYIYMATVFTWEYHPSPRDYFRFSPDGLGACFAGTPATMVECDWHEPEVSVFAFLRKDLI